MNFHLVNFIVFPIHLTTTTYLFMCTLNTNKYILEISMTGKILKQLVNITYMQNIFAKLLSDINIIHNT